MRLAHGLLLAILLGAGRARAGEILRAIRTIPLPGVEGRIDHLALDARAHRLFVAALGSHSVEVLDLDAGKRARSLHGFHEPQGVCWIPSIERLFVADGGDGACSAYDGRTLEPIGRARFPGDADNLRYDAATGRLWVGFGDGGLGIVNPRSLDTLGVIPLGAHPEAFELEPSGPRIFANLPEERCVAVVDRTTARRVAVWPCGDHAANFPLALDEGAGLLYVGTRRPPAVLSFDTRSGRRAAAVPIAGDADDLWLDGASGRLYASCGAGFIEVLERRPSGLVRVARLATAPGARTALLDAAGRRFYLAVPRATPRPAEIRVYDLAP